MEKYRPLPVPLRSQQEQQINPPAEIVEPAPYGALDLTARPPRKGTPEHKQLLRQRDIRHMDNVLHLTGIYKGKFYRKGRTSGTIYF